MSELPSILRGERAIAEYLGMPVNVVKLRHQERTLPTFKGEHGAISATPSALDDWRALYRAYVI